MKVGHVQAWKTLENLAPSPRSNRTGKKNSRELRDFLAGKEDHHHETDTTQIDLP
jgi:hypothetical protein